jgi:hypothetical protein
MSKFNSRSKVTCTFPVYGLYPACEDLNCAIGLNQMVYNDDISTTEVM